MVKDLGESCVITPALICIEGDVSNAVEHTTAHGLVSHGASTFLHKVSVESGVLHFGLGSFRTC